MLVNQMEMNENGVASTENVHVEFPADPGTQEGGSKVLLKCPPKTTKGLCYTNYFLEACGQIQI